MLSDLQTFEVASGKISCRCAAAESSCSHSGKLLSDIKVPKVIALLVRVSQVRFGYSKNSLPDLCGIFGGITKRFPVIQPAARDYIINRCKGPTGMI